MAYLFISCKVILVLKKLILTLLTTMSFSFAIAIVNINTASPAELQTLNGIGEKKAAAIVEFRTKNGSFKSVDELTKVNGIGAKTLEKLKPEITVGQQNVQKNTPSNAGKVNKPNAAK